MGCVKTKGPGAEGTSKLVTRKPWATTCSICIMSPVCMSPGLTMWYWVTNWVSSSLGKTIPPTPRNLQLPVVIWVKVSWAPVHFGMSVGAILSQLTFGQACWYFMQLLTLLGHTISQQTNPLTLTNFLPRFHHALRALDTGVFCRCIHWYWAA